MLGLTILGLTGVVAEAAPIQLAQDSVFMFRDFRTANDIGLPGGSGEAFQFGADIVGGSAGTLIQGIHASGAQSLQRACQPVAVNQNFCGNATNFNASRLDGWEIVFKNGADTLRGTMAPSLAGTTGPAPLPDSVTISSSGDFKTPVIKWQIPGGFVPDGIRINIFDKGKILPNGMADLIHSETVDPNAGSFQLPASLSNGALAEGGKYSINFQLIETRGHVPFTNNNADILRRSSSYFAFTPLDNSAPPNVALPTDINGVYHFKQTDVGPDSITFVDPFVAVGYLYEIGAGDPNFASVLLPDIGDGVFTVEFLDGAALVQEIVLANDQFFFPAGGVDAFKVLGIEEEAALDPGNVTAFITGLTFVAPGDFTGTMTPITVFVDVPEPETLMLFLVAAVATFGAAHRNSRGGPEKSPH